MISLPASDEDLLRECEVDTFRSSGPGGQHVNKTQSGVRCRHLPTGLMVVCTEQRVQGANKKRALKILAAKLATLEQEKRAAAAQTGYQTKSNMGFGASDRILSVTLQPFTLVKDHRTGWETSDTTKFLDGDLDPLIEAFLKWAASGGKPVAAGRTFTLCFRWCRPRSGGKSEGLLFSIHAYNSGHQKNGRWTDTL